jgi:hypothetical protein
VQLLMDAQMQQADIELPFQDVFKAGLMYGIGVGKSLWREEYGLERKTRRSMFDPSRNVPRRKLSRSAPTTIRGSRTSMFSTSRGIRTARTCRPASGSGIGCGSGLDDCLQRIQTGDWNAEGVAALDEERLRGLGGSSLTKYGDVWQSRMEASGFASFQTQGMERGEQIHELWEYHDGQRVICVLDRQYVVKVGESPCVGHFPFHIFRPTKVPKQMVGIGEIEPLEHLQRELDTLRSQRRDAATLALLAGYAYDSAAVHEEDIVFGPGALIEVTNASPRDAIMPLAIRSRRAPPIRRSRSSAATWTWCRARRMSGRIRLRRRRRRRRSSCRRR